MSVDDIFLEKAHEKELYLTKKLIKSLFKKYFKSEKEIRNELKERIPKMEGGKKARYYGEEQEKVYNLLQEYENLTKKLVEELKPILTSLKDKPYKKEVISILRKNFKEVHKVRLKRLFNLLKMALGEKEIMNENQTSHYILLKAKMDYGKLWHGTPIENFERIIKNKHLGGRFGPLFLAHNPAVCYTTDRPTIIFLVNVSGFPSKFKADTVDIKEAIISEGVPLGKIMKIYADEKYTQKVKEILAQNKINIPVLLNKGSEFKQDKEDIRRGVERLFEMYLERYKRIGLKVIELKNLRENVDEEFIRQWLTFPNK